jgi:hypothetical protein
MEIQMTKLSKILAALIAGSVLVQPALAQAGRQPVTVEFRYQDWQSAKENYQRLHRLVERACSSQGLKLMITRVAEVACIDGMTELAVERLGRSDLATAHHQATGRVVGSSNQVASSGG